jgi:hypothetical protein
MSYLAQVDLQKILFGTDTNTPHPVGGVNTIYDLISAILPNAYIIAGLILFIYLLAGGFMIIAASGSPDSAKNGQKVITNAIIGFIILFCSYWLIEIISTITGVPILDPTEYNTLMPQ